MSAGGCDRQHYTLQKVSSLSGCQGKQTPLDIPSPVAREAGKDRLKTILFDYRNKSFGTEILNNFLRRAVTCVYPASVVSEERPLIPCINGKTTDASCIWFYIFHLKSCIHPTPSQLGQPVGFSCKRLSARMKWHPSIECQHCQILVPIGASKRSDRQTDRQIDRQTDRQADYRQTDRQTDRQTQ